MGTTATYDEKTQEFVFNTPNIESYKFWPGALGKLCTHCVVFARCVSKGKMNGVFPFIVQVRSLKDHRPLEGVIVGDAGNKLCMVNVDNGYLAFNNFR